MRAVETSVTRSTPRKILKAPVKVKLPRKKMWSLLSDDDLPEMATARKEPTIIL